MSDESRDDEFEITHAMLMEDLLPELPWIRISEALRFLWRCKNLLEPQDPQEALLSALRTGRVPSLCEDPSKHAGFLTAYRELRPVEWANAMHLNLLDDAISLHDGTPAIGIEVDKFVLYRWIYDRSSEFPDWLFTDFGDYVHVHGGKVAETPEGQVTAVERPLARKNKGGRPFRYDWPAAYLKVLITHMYLERDLTPSSREFEVVAMLRNAFETEAASKVPDDFVLKEHAGRILKELQRADNDWLSTSSDRAVT